MLYINISGPLVSFCCAIHDNAPLSILEDLIFVLAGHHETEDGDKDSHLHQFLLTLKLKTPVIDANENFDDNSTFSDYKMFSTNQSEFFSSHEHLLESEDALNSQDYSISSVFKKIENENVKSGSIVFQYDFGANYEYVIKLDKIADKHIKNLNTLGEPFVVIYKLKGSYCSNFYELEHAENEEEADKNICDFNTDIKKNICHILHEKNPKFTDQVEQLFLDVKPTKKLKI